MKLFQKLINLLKQFKSTQTKYHLNGKEINLTSDNTTISSTNFNVDKNGKVTMKDVQILGGNIAMESDGTFPTIKINDRDGNELEMYPMNFWMTYNYNGITSQYLQKAGYYVENETTGESSEVNYNGIKTPSVQIRGAGTVMHGKNTGNTYKCNWSGSQLQFFVDETNVGTLSDARLKTEIKNIDEDFIKAIEEIEMKQFKIANRNGLVSFGILAQDLIEIFKKYNKNPFEYEIVQETQYKIDDETVYYTIDYIQFLVLKQLAADYKIKSLSEIVNQLRNKINELEEKING